MARMDWDKARRSELMKRPDLSLRASKREAGITPAQAKFLADLQRQLGVPYSGNGMRRGKASKEIELCLAALGRGRKAA